MPSTCSRSRPPIRTGRCQAADVPVIRAPFGRSAPARYRCHTGISHPNIARIADGAARGTASSRDPIVPVSALALWINLAFSSLADSRQNRVEAVHFLDDPREALTASPVPGGVVPLRGLYGAVAEQCAHVLDGNTLA